MPMVMKDVDWMRTVANAAHADGVWFQDVVSQSGTIPLDVPEAGQYRVVLLKMGNTAEIGVPNPSGVQGGSAAPDPRSTVGGETGSEAAAHADGKTFTQDEYLAALDKVEI